MDKNYEAFSLKYPQGYHIFEFKGYTCLIRQHPKMKILCGYVGVKEGHPFYQKDHHEPELQEITVHGGLSWSSFSTDFVEIPHDELAGIWFIGFACGNPFLGDLIPSMSTILEEFDVYKKEYNVSYRDEAYVKSELNQLVYQLMAVNCEY